LDLSNIFKQAQSEAIRNSGGFPDIVTFMEGDLALQPTPVQRVFLKMTYGLPLDNRHKTIVVPSFPEFKVIGKYTEADYVKYLYDQKRCNWSQSPDSELFHSIAVFGRKSGKNFMMATDNVYILARFLNFDNPHELCGIVEGDEIQMSSIATAQKQARGLFHMIAIRLARCHLKDLISGQPTGTAARLFTKHDKKNNLPPSILVQALPASTRTTRGPTQLVVSFDELGFFYDDESYAETGSEFYTAITPSLAALSPYTRCRVLSSPNMKAGKLFDLHEQGFENPDMGVVMRAPTWEVNPKVPHKFFLDLYRADPRGFMTEYGAEWSEASSPWIQDLEALYRCIDDRSFRFMATPKVTYFAGFDLGFESDPSVIVVGHVDHDQPEPVYVIDLIERMKAGEGQLTEVEALKPHMVRDRLGQLYRDFKFYTAVGDPWESYGFEDMTAEAGIPAEFAWVSQKNHTEIYNFAKMLIYSGRLRFPRFEPIIKEIEGLNERRLHSGLVRVDHLQRKGHHNDMIEATVRFLQATRLNRNKSKFSNPASLGEGTGSSSAGFAGGAPLLSGAPPAKMQQRAMKKSSHYINTKLKRGDRR
jgi:hypothetical protein